MLRLPLQKSSAMALGPGRIAVQGVSLEHGNGLARHLGAHLRAGKLKQVVGVVCGGNQPAHHHGIASLFAGKVR